MYRGNRNLKKSSNDLLSKTQMLGIEPRDSFFLFFFFLSVLGFEIRALLLLDKCSTT
jgi:hypothetical protein